MLPRVDSGIQRTVWFSLFITLWYNNYSDRCVSSVNGMICRSNLNFFVAHKNQSAQEIREDPLWNQAKSTYKYENHCWMFSGNEIMQMQQKARFFSSNNARTGARVELESVTSSKTKSFICVARLWESNGKRSKRGWWNSAIKVMGAVVLISRLYRYLSGHLTKTSRSWI